jgi:hypothetical protein
LPESHTPYPEQLGEQQFLQLLRHLKAQKNARDANIMNKSFLFNLPRKKLLETNKIMQKKLFQQKG